MIKETFQSIKRGVLSCIMKDNKISSMRVMSFITLFTVLGVFIEKNIVTHGFVDMPTNCLMVILVLIGGKVASGFSEAAKDVKMKEINAANPDETAKE